MAIDSEMDPDNLSEDDIKKLMASGVDMSQLPDLQRKARDARASKQDAFDTISSGAGGHSVNGLYLPNTAGYLVAGLRGIKANRDERNASNEIQDVMGRAKDASSNYVNAGILGRTGLPTEASSIKDMGQPDLSAAANANPMGGPPAASGAGPAGPPVTPASVQMMQVLALRRKKKAALPGQADYLMGHEGENGPDFGRLPGGLAGVPY